MPIKDSTQQFLGIDQKAAGLTRIIDEDWTDLNPVLIVSFTAALKLRKLESGLRSNRSSLFAVYLSFFGRAKLPCLPLGSLLHPTFARNLKLRGPAR